MVETSALIGPKDPTPEELDEAAEYIARRYPGTSPIVYRTSGHGMAGFGSPVGRVDLRPREQADPPLPEGFSPT